MPEVEREAALQALLDNVTAVAGTVHELEPAARATLAAVCELTGWPLGHLCVPADIGDDFVSSGLWVGAIERFPVLQEATARAHFPPGAGTIGQVITTGQPIWSSDMSRDPFVLRARQERDLGVRAVFAFPIVAADGVAAVLEFFSDQVVPRDETLLRVMASLGHQLGRVIDRRRAHQMLENSRQRLQQVIETSLEGFVSMNAAGLITDWNSAAERMFHRSRDEVLGRPLHEMIVPPRYRAADQAGRIRFLLTGESKVLGRRLELTGWRPDGSEFPIELVVWAAQDGGEWTFNAFVHDITGRRRAEAALREAYIAEQATVTRLRELDEAKSDFVATVSHEFRTPLTSISGYLEIFTDEDAEPVSERQRRMLQAMVRSTGQLQHLVEDLLAVNTIESGPLAVEPAQVPVRRILDEAVRATAGEARESGGHPVRVRLDADVGSVNADRDLLVRAVGGLLSNAIKFSPAGAPVAVRASAAGENGEDVSIAVTDAGAGIEADELPHIFDRFYRARFAKEHAIRGMGLGLSLARTIAQAHGGSLTAASTPGEGSTFTLTLPAAAGAGSGRG
ncbi:ATP-binding protein [Planomonospora sp. ID82291]|uniref:ATP-binding protein n=1 Tax=Planomonospora sp. ID82291 TaxID=2738136 RepID=UPI0018C39A14|nr:ATP-binding protein [Planomonospora sp. ID82291]MBG0817755.1 PAS domain S-box protein [Planomonospora sp. ID82291]